MRRYLVIIAVGIGSMMLGHLLWEVGSDLLWLSRFRASVERAQSAPPLPPTQ